MVLKKWSILNMFLVTVFLVTLFVGCSNSEEENIRNREKFNYGWKFIKEDLKDAESKNFDDSNWRTLDLPHDWAIEGPFTKDAYYQMGYLPYEGVGWYRKSFHINSPGKRLLLEFDGVMMFPKVYVNGEFVGEWGFGYTSFAFDITDFVMHGEKNVIAVRVENLDHSSRWYPGSGIYRNVWLTITNPIHVDHWGTYVTTPEISDEKATVVVKTVINNTKIYPSEIELTTSIINEDGNVVAKSNKSPH